MGFILFVFFVCWPVYVYQKEKDIFLKKIRDDLKELELLDIYMKIDEECRI